MKQVFKLKSLVVLASLIAVVLLFYSLTIKSAMTREITTALRVVAPSQVDPSVSETFNASIIVENVSSPGFYGYEYWLSWNSSMINCTIETLNTDIWPYYNVWVTTPIDNDNGKYHQSMTASYPSTEQIGTWWLANLTFTIIEIPETGVISTNLTLTPAEGTSYCIADKYANQIPHLFIKGTVDILPEFLEIALIPLLILSTSCSSLLARKLKKEK